MSKSFLLIAALFLEGAFGHPPKCFFGLNPGYTCDTASPSVRFRFDPQMNQCHSFIFKGCGGNKNNYETPGDCGLNCDVDLRSYVQCPLGFPPVFDSRGNSQCSLEGSETGEGCESEDAICTNFNNIALCCNRTVLTGFQDDNSATCPSGKQRWQIDGTTVLAKSCDDVTCPEGYSCNVGNFFSYCCEN
uniref:BPTI/Kunitz inhibitor domain-containing protein n=1 Tax=Caenorhabditis tropicalis TaxID=1561998 RepID=A0A1I7TYV5_9PELO